MYKSTGALYQPEPPPFEQKFEPHPLLVGVPRPGYFSGIVHDANNRRRTDNPDKAANARVIFAFGGSTTYDLANNDMVTWESDLSRLLGPGFIVENLGVPGYTSLENMIQSLFVFRDKPPACAVYFVGMNDLRNVHVEGLKSDYSDYHLPSQRGNFDFTYPGFIENNFLTVRVLLSLAGGSAPRPNGTVSSEMDPRVAKIFMDNVQLIVRVAQYFGVKPIFVPAVANWDRLTGDGTMGWFPFIRAKDMHGYVDAINADLKQAAEASGAVFVAAPLDQTWGAPDFQDSDHFNGAGAQKFAASIAPKIAELCR